MINRYKRSPTIQEVDFIIKMSGFREAVFERFYGMSQQSIKHFRSGYRPLAEKYWHLFFDPPKPIRNKIDSLDALRAKCAGYLTRRKVHHVSRFEKVEKKKEHRMKIKKIGVLAQLLS